MNSYNFPFHQLFSEVNEKQIGWFELHLLSLSRTSLGDGANERWNKRRLVTVCSRPACRCLDIWHLRAKEVSIKHNRKLGSYVDTYAWPNKIKIYIKGKLLFQFLNIKFYIISKYAKVSNFFQSTRVYPHRLELCSAVPRELTWQWAGASSEAQNCPKYGEWVWSA